MGEAGKEAWQGKSSTEVNLREILGAPDTSDSQANRVDRIHVGYVDERARFIDRCPILLSASSTAPNPTLFSTTLAIYTHSGTVQTGWSNIEFRVAKEGLAPKRVQSLLCGTPSFRKEGTCRRAR